MSSKERPSDAPDMETILEVLDPVRRREERERIRAELERPTPVWIARRVAEIGGEGEAEGAEERPVAEEGPVTEERPVTKAARAREARRWPATWKLIGGCVLVMATMPPLVVLAGRAKETKVKESATASATASVSAAPMMNATVMPSATVMLSTTAMPSATVPDAGVAVPLRRPRSPGRPIAPHVEPSPAPPATTALPQDPRLNE